MPSLRSQAAILALSALLWSFAPPAAAQQPRSIDLVELSKSVEQMAARVGPAVVQVLSSGFAPSLENGGGTVVSRGMSTGSGAIVDPSGYIITNHHVLDRARRVQVLLASRIEPAESEHSILKSRPRLRDAVVVGMDDETDLAVLKVEEENLPYLRFGDSEKLRPGQIVFAFGSPMGLENSVTMGVVSSVARQLEPDSPMIYIQTDSAINPGNSGGPLVNAAGEIVGLNTLILSQSGGNEGIGFAAPSNIVSYVYSQLREYGRVRRGEIGAAAQTITPLLAEALGLPRDWGVIVSDITPLGPAEAAGLETGDIVAALDSKPMENARQFKVNLYQRRVGDVVRLDVLRGGEELSVTVVVIERAKGLGRLSEMVSRDENYVRRLGVLALPLDPDIARLIPMLRQPGGVAVAARTAGGPDSGALFLPGDVIFEVNGARTWSLRELREALDRIPPGGAAALQVQRQGSQRYITFQIE